MRFIENLEKYEHDNMFSRSDILELAGIMEDEIHRFETDCHNEAMYRFCVNLELDFSSIYSDAGFRSCKLIDQYIVIPSGYNYKSSITKQLFKSILPKVESESAFKKKLSGLIGSSTKVSRFINGNSSLTAEEIPLVANACSPDISYEDFNYMFASIMWSRIPNINLCTAKTIYKFTLAELAEQLNTNKSTPGNWSGNMNVSLPNKYIAQIGNILGDFNYQQFATMVITKKQFKSTSCKLSIANKLPDPILDEEPIKHLDSRLEEDSKVNDIANPTKPDIIEDPISNSPVLTFSDERIAKMYKALTERNRIKVEQTIIDLFFEQLN